MHESLSSYSVSEFERVKKIIECQNCEHFHEDKENNDGTINDTRI